MKILNLFVLAFVIISMAFAFSSCLECPHSNTREEVLVPATCFESGLANRFCSYCGEYLGEYKLPGGHVGDTPVKENKVDATCTTDGHHDLVVYCYRCDIELSRNYVFVPAGHTLTLPVEENKIDATCTEDGEYDSVVYCYVCDAEVSREHKIIAGGHIEVLSEENRTEFTCTVDGTYDSVVSCSVCKEELSRKTVVTIAPGHMSVVDEAIEATCGNSGLTEGSHCSVCSEVLVAQEVVPQLTAHGETYTAVENDVPAGDYTEGRCDIVVYCSVCNKEYSRTTVTTPPLIGSNPDTIFDETDDTIKDVIDNII